MKKKFSSIGFPIICLLIFIAVSALSFLIFTLACGRSFSDAPESGTETEFTASLPSLPYGGGYLADMSAYEEYINPIGGKRNAFLSLKYKPEDLTVVNDAANGKGVSLSLYAAKALEAMLIEMRAQNIDLTNPQSGLTLTVISGYDENNVSGDDRETGLSVIIHNCSLADVSFENTKAGIWLKENCHKFGFIIRYPQGKSAETGETYSPWYFRYVGRYHAERMIGEDLCLEEYLSKYNYK